MNVYNIIFIVMILDLIVVKLLSSKKCFNKRFLIINGIILILIYGLRSSSVGIDTHTYREMFNDIAKIPFNQLTQYWSELGYTLLNKFIYILGGNFQILLLINGTLIVVGTMYLIYKNSYNVVFSVFLYISFMFYFSSMNAMRQFMAISIVYIAFQCIKDNKKNKFFIFIIVAMLFHESALIFVSIYFLKNIQFDIYKALGILGIFYLTLKVGIINILIKLSSFSGYTQTSWIEKGNYMHFIMYFMILVFCLSIRYLYKRSNSITNKYLDKDENTLYWCVFNSVLFQLGATQIHILVRMANYFMPFVIILIPNTIVRINDKNTRLILYILIIIMALAYGFLYISKGAQGAIPYKYFWQY